ncbi:DUF58 domain-containing protein, partial [Amycolatopsis sp. H20-H5]|nr:DUF58 domain-containing protein [Amycolatopsis sp. H20-H5]
MWRLTRRGGAVLALSLLLGVAGYLGGYPVLWVLGVVLFAAVVSAVLVTIWGVRVDVRRSVYPDRVERGEPAVARLQVRNPTDKRQAAFLATDQSDGGVRTVQVRGLPAGGEAVYHYELATAKRGKAEVGPLTLLRSDPFGLAAHRVPTGETATLWVHPRRLAARALVDGHPRHHHEGATTDDALRGAVDLQDVREYTPGVEGG